MFGLLRPVSCGLDRDDRRDYQQTYCNLCGCLSRQYGLASRTLLVFDFATLAWLFEESPSQARPLGRLNCVTGGVLRARSSLRPVDRFLAALSAYTCGVKVRDNLRDEQRLRDRLAEWTYAPTFEKARRDLMETGFDVGALEALLAAQQSLEETNESCFERSSRPTGAAYAVATRHLVNLSGAEIGAETAAKLAEILGRCVYLVDAYRDCAEDAGRNYNPLCCTAGEPVAEVPAVRKRELREYMLLLLMNGRRVAVESCQGTAERWDAIARRMRALLGLRRPEVTLNATCCIPCGDSVIAVSDSDVSQCCVGCCCWMCICAYCCTRG